MITPPAPSHNIFLLYHRPVATGGVGCDPPHPPPKCIRDFPANLDKEQIGICCQTAILLIKSSKYADGTDNGDF